MCFLSSWATGSYYLFDMPGLGVVAGSDIDMGVSVSEC